MKWLGDLLCWLGWHHWALRVIGHGRRERPAAYCGRCKRRIRL